MARAWSWRSLAALTIALFACLCAPGLPVRADHIQFGTRSIDYCATVTNIDQFPAYVFFFVIDPVGSPGRISQSDCVHATYKVATLRFSAIRADAFDPAAFAAHPRDYLTTTRGVVRAAQTFDALISVDTLDPRDAAVDMLHIVRVDAGTLDIAPVSVRYTYRGGRTETLPYTTINQYPPAPGVPLWYAILVPALALFGIILVVARRRGNVRIAHG